jgi:hypothetical protein
MDFHESPEHAAFRGEFRAWLVAHLPPDLCVGALEREAEAGWTGGWHDAR